MNRFQFLALCCPSIARLKHWLEKRGGAAALFAVFVGGALQDDHTEHACVEINSPQVSPYYFVPEIFLWRLAPMK